MCVGFVFALHRRFAIRRLSLRSDVCVCVRVYVRVWLRVSRFFFFPRAEYVRGMSVRFTFWSSTLCDPKTFTLHTPARTHKRMHTKTHAHSHTHTQRTHTHTHTHARTHTHTHTKNCLQGSATDSAPWQTRAWHSYPPPPPTFERVRRAHVDWGATGNGSAGHITAVWCWALQVRFLHTSSSCFSEFIWHTQSLLH